MMLFAGLENKLLIYRNRLICISEHVLTFLPELRKCGWFTSLEHVYRKQIVLPTAIDSWCFCWESNIYRIWPNWCTDALRISSGKDKLYWGRNIINIFYLILGVLYCNIYPWATWLGLLLFRARALIRENTENMHLLVAIRITCQKGCSSVYILF